MEQGGATLFAALANVFANFAGGSVYKFPAMKKMESAKVKKGRCNNGKALGRPSGVNETAGRLAPFRTGQGLMHRRFVRCL